MIFKISTNSNLKFIGKNFALNKIFIGWFLLLNFFQIHQFAMALTLAQAIEAGIANNQELAIEMQKIANVKLQNWRVLQENLPAIYLNFNKGNRDIKNQISPQNSQQSQFSARELMIEQNLFLGFSSLFNHQKNQFEYLKNIALFNEKKQILASQIANLYGKIFYQEKILNNLNNILDLYQKILKNEAHRLKFGLITNLEIQNLNTAILKVSQQIAILQSQYFTNHQDYALMVGIEAKNLEKIDLESDDKIKFEPKLIEQNYLLQAKNFDQKILQVAQKLNYANSAPKISLQIGFSRQNNNNLYFPNQQIHSKSLAVNMVVPIFQQGKEYLDFKQMQNNQNIVANEYNFLKEKLLNEFKKDCFEIENSRLNQQKCRELQNIILSKIADCKQKIQAKTENINQLHLLEIAGLEQEIECHKNQENIHNLYYKILANIGGMNV